MFGAWGLALVGYLFLEGHDASFCSRPCRVPDWFVHSCPGPATDNDIENIGSNAIIALQKRFRAERFKRFRVWRVHKP